MTNADYDRFCEQFDLLAVTHRLVASEDLRAKMKAEYFDILRPYPLPAIEGAYQTLRRRMKKWPVPADWFEAMPASHALLRLPLATAEELAEVEEAQALGHERDELCQCPVCVRAQTTHLHPRYVPRLDRDGGLIKRRHPTKPEPIVLGRWLHGDELRAWCAARAEFYLAYRALCDQVERERRAVPTDPEARMQRLITVARVASIE